MAADAAMVRGDRTAALAAGRRIGHALEYTLITGEADALATEQQETVGCRPGNAERIQDLEGSSVKQEPAGKR